jgi:hypothetical protein
MDFQIDRRKTERYWDRRIGAFVSKLSYMPEPEQTELELGAVKKSLENAKIVLET